jgi:drug/metabolite transporter (DMT)-like permease
VASTSTRFGVLCVLASTAFFSLTATFVVNAYRDGANPVGVLTVRFAIASIFMVLARGVMRPNAPWPSRRAALQLMALGGTSYFAGALLYFNALARMDSGLSIVIFYTYPILVVFGNWMLNKHRPTRNIVIALAMSLTGVVITVGQVGDATGAGVILCFASTITYTVYTLGSARVLPKTDLFTGVTLVMIGAFVCFALLSTLGSPFIDVSFPETSGGWINVVLLAIVATAVPTGVFFVGIRNLGPNTTSLITTFEPVLTIVAGVAFLAETFTLARGIGAAFVIGALIVFGLLESRSTKTPEVL